MYVNQSPSVGKISEQEIKQMTAEKQRLEQDEAMLPTLMARLEVGVKFLKGIIPEIEDKVLAIHNDGPLGAKIHEAPEEPVTQNQTIVFRLMGLANNLENSLMKLERLRNELKSIV